MNSLPRETLCTLVAQYGHSLWEDPRRCEGLLRDFCGDHRREVNLLVAGLKEQVAAELLASRGAAPKEVVFTRLARRLCEDLALTEDAAQWTVESWALALGVFAGAEPGPSPQTAQPAPTSSTTAGTLGTTVGEASDRADAWISVTKEALEEAESAYLRAKEAWGKSRIMKGSEVRPCLRGARKAFSRAREIAIKRFRDEDLGRVIKAYEDHLDRFDVEWSEYPGVTLRKWHWGAPPGPGLGPESQAHWHWLDNSCSEFKEGLNNWTRALRIESDLQAKWERWWRKRGEDTRGGPGWCVRLLLDARLRFRVAQDKAVSGDETDAASTAQDVCRLANAARDHANKERRFYEEA